MSRATRPSGRDGEEELAVGAFREADGVVDGVAGAVDLSRGDWHIGGCSSSGPHREGLFDPDENRFLEFDVFLMPEMRKMMPLQSRRCFSQVRDWVRPEAFSHGWSRTGRIPDGVA